MMTVKEMSRRTGVSIRTLQYYDRIGLLRPAGHTASSYRLMMTRIWSGCSRFCCFGSFAFR